VLSINSATSVLQPRARIEIHRADEHGLTIDHDRLGKQALATG
jgi:hypothetical protein